MARAGEIRVVMTAPSGARHELGRFGLALRPIIPKHRPRIGGFRCGGAALSARPMSDAGAVLSRLVVGLIDGASCHQAHDLLMIEPIALEEGFGDALTAGQCLRRRAFVSRWSLSRMA